MKEQSFYPIPACLRRMIKHLILVLGCLISVSSPANITPCSGKRINPVTDICWDCLLPITLGGSTIKSGSNPDTSNPGSTFCRCPPASVGLPVDSLFWCAGAQGTMYPVTGNVAEHIGGVQASVLLSERLLFKLHRLGLVQDSNSSPDGLCSEHYTFPLPKSRYHYQMTYPVATTKSLGCQPFGRSTIPWEGVYSAAQETPTSTDNYGYLIWKKRNCCN